MVLPPEDNSEMVSSRVVWVGCYTAAVVSHRPVDEYTQLLLLLYCHICVFQVLASSVWFWLRKQGLPFLIRHSKVLPSIGMSLTVLSQFATGVTIMQAARVSNLSTAEATTHAVMHSMLRPLVTKVIIDPPAWGLLLLMLLQSIAISTLSPALHAVCTNGFSIIAPCMVLYAAAVIWIEYSRRSQFLETLRMYKAQNKHLTC